MAHHALVGTAGPAARLGRAVGEAAAVGGVALLLPDGERESGRGPSRRAHAAALPLARALARAGAGHGLVAHVLRYRGRGWNGADAGPAEDARWAASEAVRRYGEVPLCLVGHGMGGRAALRAADHPAVVSVVALAPWLPPDEPADPVDGEGGHEPEPVRQLIGRRVLIAHGTHDRRGDPEASFRLGERIKKVNRDTCRFEVHTDDHRLRRHRAEVAALTADFALGALFARPFARPVADALAAPPPLGLRMPLAAGFGERAGRGRGVWRTTR
ncbi:alpha/beta hydrolase [Streptomyces solincola]|uniref:Alpha/beta hydrolase n=1 Tax=Streptomyces solincola TaxID=2100817 RepID=A0A2S9PQS9_9ACTN|nr:alpha/beta hydrolase [Streptomyces solincola]PRH76761.1 alpha/beta hydrolase [Streptomyces solincola]